MKNLILFLSLLCLPAMAQVTVTTVTITNVIGATNGSTIVLNGVSRLFTNHVTAPLVEIQSTNTQPLLASNIFAAYVTYQNPQIQTALIQGTNIQFTSFPGFPATVTLGGNFGFVTTVSYVQTNAYVVRVPYTVEGPAQLHNIADLLVSYLNQATTNFLNQNAQIASNFVNTGLSQIILGAKNFTGGLSGTGGTGTNRNELNLSITNGQNYGNAFRSPGAASVSEQFGSGASALGIGSTAVGNGSLASNFNATAVGANAVASNLVDSAFGAGAIATGGGASAIGDLALATGASSTALGFTAQANGVGSTALGMGAVANFSDSIVMGNSASDSAANQVVLGSSAYSVLIQGGLTVAGSVTNLHVVGTNILNGDLSFVRKDNASLANGANAAISLSTNVFNKLSGPSGAFSIDGFTGGRDGRYAIIENISGQTMTINNDSGLDPAATNRIYTGTGSAIVTSTDPGIVQMIYDSSLTHWIIMSVH